MEFNHSRARACCGGRHIPLEPEDCHKDLTRNSNMCYQLGHYAYAPTIKPTFYKKDENGQWQDVGFNFEVFNFKKQVKKIDIPCASDTCISHYYNLENVGWLFYKTTENGQDVLVNTTGNLAIPCEGAFLATYTVTISSGYSTYRVYVKDYHREVNFWEANPHLLKGAIASAAEEGPSAAKIPRLETSVENTCISGDNTQQEEMQL